VVNIPGSFSAPTMTAPAYNSVVVSPSDATNITGGFRSLYVGGGGNIAVVGFDDNPCLFVAVPQGTILPVMGKRVNLTNTTASLMVALR
jgi:hypothetical protein